MKMRREERSRLASAVGRFSYKKTSEKLDSETKWPGKQT